MQITSHCLLTLETWYTGKQAKWTSQFQWSFSQCKNDKSISKQQPDTATYHDEQSSTRVRHQVHLPGQHYQSLRRCRRRHQNTIGKSQVSIWKSTFAMEILSILRKDQTQNLPDQCPLCTPLRLRMLAHDTTRHQ